MRKRIFARLAMLALLAAVLLLPSCRRAAEKARENIRIEAVESVEMHALSGFDLTLRVKNDTRHKLLLRSASLSLWYCGAHVADVVLREEAEVVPRTTGSVTTRWKFAVEDPLALFALVRKIDSGDLSQVGVSYRIDGKGGPMPVNISQEQMPLSDFLRTFGLKIDDLKNYLGK